MAETKAARRSCNYDTRLKTVHSKDTNSLSDFNRGAWIAGIIIAISFGLIFVHSALMGVL